MKLWNCVYSYGNNYEVQRIFGTREDAEKWFNTIAGEANGDADKGEDYMTYHEYDDRHPIDVSCALVDLE